MKRNLRFSGIVMLSVISGIVLTQCAKSLTGEKQASQLTKEEPNALQLA